MAEYGITRFGTDVYGLSLPPAYLVPDFTATPVNYSTIRITWGKPSGTISRYRLLANRNGYPVSETDGTILFDQVDYPGGAWNDSAIIPGSYHHYGFYVLVDPVDDIWIRAGVTGCLAPVDFRSSQWMWDKLPNHFKYLDDGHDLTGDATGNSYLQQFLNILGWGWDRVRTQYEYAAQTLNDPYSVPVNDLQSLAAEVGLDYAPGMPSYAIRKGVANQAHVSRQRGTLLGLANEVTIRTGWGADTHMGPNLLLNTDQSAFLSPAFEPWLSTKYYQVGECVWVGPATSSRVWTGTGYWYQCATGNKGQQPPGNGTSNTYWTCLNNSGDFLGTLINPKSSLPSSWEAMNTANANGTTLTGTLSQSLGILNLTGAGYAWNGLTVTNKTTSTQTYMLRSVSRKTSDLSLIPDPSFDGGWTLLVPSARPDPTWVPTTWPKVYAYVPNNTNPVWYFPGQKGQTGGKYLATAFWTGTNCWITSTTTNTHSGPRCGLITARGSGVVQAYSPWVAVTSGQSVTASLWMRPTSAATVPLQIVWRDSHGGQISVTAGTGVALTANTYGQLTASGTAPAGTAYANITPVIPAAQTVRIDDASVIVTAAPSTTYSPDQTDVINHGVPVPWTRPSQVWNASRRYVTNDIVQYQNQPFLALRASTGSTPPVNSVASPDWAPLSPNERIRLCESAYVSQNTTVTTNQTVPVTPFAEWYDQHGNFISRVFARTATNSGATGKPAGVTFDSFTTQSRLATSGPSGSVPLSNWAVTFWANDSMTNPVAATRTDTSLNFNWAGASPNQSVGNANWSARWTTSFTPTVAGTYTFTMSSPGGGYRLLINGGTVIDNWSAMSTAAKTGSVTLPAGASVAVEVDYYVPPSGNGATTSNLIPGVWNPGTIAYGTNANWTSPLFPVVANETFKYTVSVTGGTASAQAPVVPQKDPEMLGATLGTPSNGSTVNITTTSAVIHFTGVAGATSYRVQVYKGSSTSGTLVYDKTTNDGTAGADGIPVTGLTPSTAYAWRVVAYGSSGSAGTWSGLIGFATAAPSITAQVNWYNGKTLIRSDTSKGTITAVVSGTPPAGANWAGVYVSLANSSAGFTQSFTQVQSAVVPTGVSLTSPVPYTSTGGTQFSPYIAGRLTDDSQSSWTVPTGSAGTFLMGSGLATPKTVGQRTYALLTGSANTQIAVTLRSSPDAASVAAGHGSQGIIFRWTSDTAYWRSGRNTLKYVSGSTWTTVATHSTPFKDGDRMTVILNGTSIRVLRNGVQVSAATSSYNSTASTHGIVANDVT